MTLISFRLFVCLHIKNEQNDELEKKATMTARILFVSFSLFWFVCCLMARVVFNVRMELRFNLRRGSFVCNSFLYCRRRVSAHQHHYLLHAQMLLTSVKEFSVFEPREFPSQLIEALSKRKKTYENMLRSSSMNRLVGSRSHFKAFHIQRNRILHRRNSS